MLRTEVRGLLLVILLAAVAVGSPLSGQETPTPEGHWLGAIQTPEDGLGINVDLMEEDGVWTGDISIPQQMLEDFALGGIMVDGLNVRFAMEGIPGAPSFVGTLSEDGQTLSGTFTQGMASFPFRLTRGG